MYKKINLPYYSSFYSNYCTKVKIDPNLKEQFDSQLYKPRKHPGSARIKTVSLPSNIQKAIKLIFEDTGAKSLCEESRKLNSYLQSRLLPPESYQIDEKAAKIYNNVSKSYFSKINKELSPDELEKCNKDVQVKVFNILKRNVYGWANISYDKPTSLQYLMTRAAPEYAASLRVLDEIKKKCPDFKPRSFFDFGSGVGTGTWAVNTLWKNDIFEYFTVDTSADMNELARLILCDGKENIQMPMKGYFQRQFLPATSTLKYNIVFSAYSLLELPNMKSRLETIQKLWNKTEDFLIIIENGTNAGFHVINEARDFVLNLNSKKNVGYAFSPCPNDNVCPRYLEHKTPCNFIVKCETLNFGSKAQIVAELFSYVILRKGARPSDDPQWPRVVRAPIVRSGHTICRLCTKEGELKEIIFSKAKYDQVTYRCARSCSWGDELPMK